MPTPSSSTHRNTVLISNTNTVYNAAGGFGDNNNGEIETGLVKKDLQTARAFVYRSQ